MLDKIRQTAEFLKKDIKSLPEIGIILGSGLGGLVKQIEVSKAISYHDIPGFPVSTVEGHSGNLIFGTLGGKSVVAMQGRFHFYEGYPMDMVTFPVRVMKYLGIKYLIVSNASGGLNPDFKVGDLMIISDHINFFPQNPLIGKNYSELGPRFPDMSKPYAPELIEKAKAIAAANNIEVRTGVYVGSSGPTYETPAEYKFFRIIGADATGMSTVPEVIVARQMDITVFGISIITNCGTTKTTEDETSHDEVKNVAGDAEPKMTLIIRELVRSI